VAPGATEMPHEIRAPDHRLIAGGAKFVIIPL
jgi:hypothetical protein